MESPAIPANEVERLEALYRYQILNTLPTKTYDDIVSLAASICNVPISLISLVDKDRCWFKAKVGLEQSEAPRRIAYAAHAINEPNKAMVVEDALDDERFADCPLVLQDSSMRFYAGIPLVTPDGFAIGALCVVDKVPRQLTAQQIEMLRVLANQVVSEFELQLKQKEVTQLNAQLQQANKRQESFSYSVAHDLRAPLKNMEGFLNLLDETYREQLDSLGKELLRELKTNSIRIDTVIQDIWNLSKISFTELHHRSIDLSDLCNNVLIRIAPKNNYSIKVQDGMQIRGDSAFLTIAMENLISNAIKYSSKEANPQVSIGQTDRNGQSVYFVRDNGIGVRKEESTKIFQPFYRTHTEGEYEGMGIGLSIVKKIVNRHGGKIWVSSTLGEGATFYFKF